MANRVLLSVTRYAGQKFNQQTLRAKKMLLVTFCLITGVIALSSIVSPSDEISKAKDLLDAGTISAAEFNQIRSRIIR